MTNCKALKSRFWDPGWFSHTISSPCCAYKWWAASPRARGSVSSWYMWDAGWMVGKSHRSNVIPRESAKFVCSSRYTWRRNKYNRKRFKIAQVAAKTLLRHVLNQPTEMNPGNKEAKNVPCCNVLNTSQKFSSKLSLSEFLGTLYSSGYLYSHRIILQNS